MLHIILFCPEIPQNTGNIGRLCAITNNRLHLIHPLGFTITDRHLKRSGMDYWHHLDLIHHKNWEAFENHPQSPKNLWLFTTKTKTSFWQANYQNNDGLLFGNESQGCPTWLHEKILNKRVTIPHLNENMRSLNLATSVGIGTYEAMRQIAEKK